MNLPSIRVALVDDHSIVRRGIRAYLNAQLDIEVVGEAASAEEMLPQLVEWQPTVLVMDVYMPGGINGIEATQKVKKLLPMVNVIMLSGFDDDARIIGALRAGAITYLAKDAQPETLLEAIRQAAQGKAALDPQLMQRIIEAQAMRYADILTGRELDVIQSLSDGLTNAEIASKLVVSEETVKSHISNILRKLNLSHRTQIAIFALRNQLVK